MNDLEKLFLSELQDIYDAEHQLVKALDELKDAAKAPELKAAFASHLLETKTHVKRLEDVFQALGQKPKRQTCNAIEGIIDETQTLAEKFADNTALDAGLIAAAQKAEHYEITSYGSLCAWARELGNTHIESLLRQIQDEERAADEKLSQLAQSALNREATWSDTDKSSSTMATLKKLVTHGT